MNNPDLHPRYYWLNNQIILMLPSGLYTKCGCITTFSHPANLEGLIPVDQPGRTSDPWTRPTESEIRSWNKALNQSPPSEESILASATLGGVIGLPIASPVAKTLQRKYSHLLNESMKSYGITEITPLAKRPQRFFNDPEIRPCTKPCANKLCYDTVEHGRYVFIHCEACKETKAFDQAETGFIRQFTLDSVIPPEPRQIQAVIVGADFMKAGYGTISVPLQQRVVQWAEATFPNQPTEGKIAHLEDEIKEVRENPNDGEELADCLLLLFNLAGRAGVDLLAEAEKKLAKNMKRTWGKQDERGVVHHVEE